jgi:putative membrane protein
MPDWHPHPDVWFLMTALAVGYLLSVRVVGLRPAGGSGKSQAVAESPVHRVSLARQISFLLGVGFLWLGADWPIHEIAEERLFSVHMIQHTLFSLIAPPLLLLGLPPELLRRVFRSNRSLRLLRAVTRPVVALALFNGVVLATHWPVIVDASLRSEPLHFGVHALLFTSAILMWWPVVEPLPELKQLSEPAKMFYLFLQSILPTVPASFLTFADAPIYHFYESVPRMWGLSVLIDQQIAGLIMKIGGGLLLWLCIATIYFRWNAKEERGDEPAISWEEFERELEVWELRKG